MAIQSSESATLTLSQCILTQTSLTPLHVQKSRWVSLFNSTLLNPGSLCVARFSFLMANLLTILRLILSPFLLLLQPLSISFCSLYVFLGFTDILDGFIARRTKTTSTLGSLLDSIGDIVFCATSFIAIYPLLHFNLFLLFLIALIFILRVINLATGLMKEKKLILLHTVTNKVTGLLLFIFPLTLNLIPYALSSTVIAVAALYASIDEGILIWKGRIK